MKNDTFSQESILDAFEYAFRNLYELDHKLFAVDVQERAIAGRLAMHLRQYYLQYETRNTDDKSYFIDIEYNRDRSHVKNPCNYYKSWTAPDIIFHNRGRSGENDNIFCCEIKKNSQSGKYDSVKIKKLLDAFGYLYGFDIYKLSYNVICFDLYEKLLVKQGNRKYSKKMYQFTLKHGIEPLQW